MFHSKPRNISLFAKNWFFEVDFIYREAASSPPTTNSQVLLICSFFLTTKETTMTGMTGYEIINIFTSNVITWGKKTSAYNEEWIVDDSKKNKTDPHFRSRYTFVRDVSFSAQTVCSALILIRFAAGGCASAPVVAALATICWLPGLILG